MDNYPPGVTGNEYEIAGPDHEWYDEDWVCTNEIKYILIPEEIVEKIQFFFGAFQDDTRLKFIESYLKERLAQMYYMISNYTSDSPEFVIKECKNQGAEKESYRGEEFWECYECGKRYSEWSDYRD